MTRFTSIFMVLALICVSAIGCGEDDPAAPTPEPETTGTVVVDRNPNTLSCIWQLTGPDSYIHNGTGDETLTKLEPGDYTLTWTAMSGWNSPDPSTEIKSVTAGETTTFTGTYVLQAGSITVNPEPNAIDAPWTLTGPSSYSHSGTGDETVPGLTPGSYTITWEAVSGWDLPDPATEVLVLADGGTVTFNGTYTEQSVSTGTVRVQPQNVTDAPWHLDGPSSYSHDGTGYEELTEMEVGDYTVTWDEVSGYTTPAQATQTLTEGGNILFQGAYGAQTSDLYVDVNPDVIDAPWHLDGPGGWTYDGTGDIHLTGRIWGDYTITWGAVSGWSLPDPPTEMMTLDGTFYQTFTGNYTQAWDPEMVLITGGKFQMGSPVTELGRYEGSYGDETQHWVQVSSFYMCTTEITHSQYQFIFTDHAYNPDFADRAHHNAYRSNWIELCNTLSVRDGYTPCYTVNGSDVSWDRNANGYRMPTEAEWEYACRAGSTTAFANGEITDTGCADPLLDLIGWYCGNAVGSFPQPVAGLAPNAWGLYDMHGNAPEMCWDYLGDYGTGTFEDPDIDPIGPETGSYYVCRSYLMSTAAHSRSARRGSTTADEYANGGMRLVRNAP